MWVQVLRETCLIEAFNLKAAIEYNMKSFAAAREALADAPPRTEEELDPVYILPLHPALQLHMISMFMHHCYIYPVCIAGL